MIPLTGRCLYHSLEDIALWQSQLTQQGYGPQFDWPEFDWLEEMRSHTASGTAETEHYMLTNHSDGGGTTQLIHNLRPQHVIFCAWSYASARRLGQLRRSAKPLSAAPANT